MCKNSGARWILRNDGKKGSQESKEGNLYSISPLLRAQGPGLPGTLQTHSIPVAHMQTPHAPCGCLVLTGIELDFSSPHNVLETLFMPARASHLHHLIFSSSTLSSLFSPPFFYCNVLQVTASSSQQVMGITTISVPPLVLAVSQTPCALSP